MARDMAHELAPKDISEAVAFPKKKTEISHRKLSRRQFLVGSVALGAAAAVGSITGRGFLDNANAVQTEIKPLAPSIPEIRTPESILNQIKQKYGVEIPNTISPEFTKEEYDGRITPNIIPTLEQAEVIEESIGKIPAAEFLSPLVIPYRNSSEGAVAGGSFMGQQWPVFIHPKEYSKFPDDVFVSEKAAIDLEIPDKKNSDPLPVKNDKSSLLPTLSQISIESANMKVNLHEDVPWTNHGERLKQATIHEFFHGLQEAVSVENSSSIEEYWDRQSISLYNSNIWDINNPLFATFAKVAGWQLVSSYESIKQYDPEAAEEFLKSKPESALNNRFWERDPKVWGELKNRKNHLTVYASYGPLQESMAETWMAYYLYPELLTVGERQYFDNIDAGLRDNPQKFVQEIVKNPNLLLNGVEIIE